MLQISYDTGCRQCLKSEGIRSMYLVDGANLEDYKKKTEYEVMLQVEHWRNEDAHVCKICGSPNVEITNIQADDYLLYDYENMVSRCIITREDMYMLNIDKREFKLTINEGGNNNPNIHFLHKCFSKMIDIINQIPDEKFVSHSNGNFFVCFTGSNNFIGDIFEISIERFRFHGVSKSDVASGINKMLNKLGFTDLFTRVKNEPKPEKEPSINILWKSSDHLRFENGVHVSGPHGGAPRAIKIEPNITGQRGYSVTIFNMDREQTNIQMAPKQMELIHADINKFVLKGYGFDSYGASFSDYGLSIYHDQGNIKKIVLHMYDRKIDLEYMP